jgi:membrane protein YdbS with pleckstrin-like domain
VWTIVTSGHVESDWLQPERTDSSGVGRQGGLGTVIVVSTMAPAAGDGADLLASPTGTWSGVSPSLATARRLVLAVSAVLASAIWGVLTIGLGGRVTSVFVVIGVVGLVLIVAATATGLAWIGPVARAWGFALSDDVVYIRRGRMFRQLTAVPYARLQYVDVTAGPLDRRFGLASVRLHTASASTDAHIPGLPTAAATELRDTLTTLSEGRYAGL